VSGTGRGTVRAGLTAISVGALALALKLFAAWRTDSLALLADAAESIVNLVAALVATASVTYATRPTDDKHPFGHGKVEYLSAGIEGALVVLAAGVVAFEAIARFGDAPRREMLAVGLAVALLATGANAVLVRYLDRAGRRLHSAPLLADAQRLRGGVRIALVVYAGFGAAWISAWWPLDALLALGLSGHILIAGLRAVRHSVSGLFDESMGGDELATIERLLGGLGPPVVGYRDLQARRSSGEVVVELALVVSRYSMVYEAHETSEQLEAAIERFFPAARISIRIVPEGSEPATQDAASV